MSGGSDRAALKSFGAVWIAQLLSVLGSSLSGFALGVWAYQRTGSVTQFGLIFAANTLPGVLVAPFAGSLVDRFDRKWMLVAGDVGAAVATAAAAVLVGTGNLEVWHIYLTTAVGSSFTFLHRTAFFALVPALVPKHHLARANGLMQFGQAVTVAAPILAGVLLTSVGLGGVLLVDLASFAVALGVLAAARLPAALTRPEPTGPGGTGGAAGFRSDLGHGWRFLVGHRPLLLLVLFSAAYDLLFAFAAVLVRPLILGFASPSTLGVLEFLGGLGMIAGSLAMSAWGGPRRKLDGIVLFTALGGVALALHSLAASPWLIAVVAPLFLFTMPIVNSLVYTLLQLKVPGESLGRVSAAAQMVFQAAMPVGALVAGPLADGVFEPVLQPGGALAGTAGAVVGTGPGRGIALLFAVTGVLLILLALGTRMSAPLYRLEDRVPDAVPDPADPDPARPGDQVPEESDLDPAGPATR